MSEEESEKLIEYKTLAFHSAINDLYKCESYFNISYDSSTCIPYVKYDPKWDPREDHFLRFSIFLIVFMGSCF